MSRSTSFLSLIATLPLVVLMGSGTDQIEAPSMAGNEDKVVICHNAGPSKQLELEVSENAVEAHVTQHGDTVGPCGGGGGDDTLR